MATTKYSVPEWRKLTGHLPFEEGSGVGSTCAPAGWSLSPPQRLPDALIVA
jgi:hypothetical protein